jgi:hypothetical protein
MKRRREMTTKTRITKLEQAQQTNDGGRIAIYYENDGGRHGDIVRVDWKVEMTRAEWDKIKTDKDTEIVIQYVRGVQ